MDVALGKKKKEEDSAPHVPNVSEGTGEKKEKEERMLRAGEISQSLVP